MLKSIVKLKESIRPIKLTPSKSVSDIHNHIRKLSGVAQNEPSEESTSSEPAVEKLPEHSKVVICGGGVLGASVAYHLAELGWGPDTIVLEQGR